VAQSTIWELMDGEEKGIGGGFDIVDDLRQPPAIFKFTYDQKKTLSVDNKPYLIPDGVSGSTIRRTIQSNETLLTQSWSDYYTYKFKSTSINLGASYQGFTLTAAFTGTRGYINQLVKNGTRSFGWNGAAFITFALQFKSAFSRPPLDDDFQADLNRLPAAYQPEVYRRFLRQWGTHYFTRAIYGCQFNVTVSIDKKFQEERTVKWATSQLDLTIKYQEQQLGFKQEKVVNKSQIDGGFLDGAKVDANARGGDETKFIVGRDFDGWLASCNNRKVALVIYSDIEPITDVIPEGAKQKNVRQAILDYGKAQKK
jgi:hypothetical protein